MAYLAGPAASLTLFVLATAGCGKPAYVVERMQASGSVSAAFCKPVFTPDGETLIAGNGFQIAAWGVRSQRMTALLPQQQLVNCVAISPDGLQFAAACGTTEGQPPFVRSRYGYTQMRGEVRVFDARTYELKCSLSQDKGGALGVAYSPDGKSLAVVVGSHPEADGEVLLYNTADFKVRARLRGHRADILSEPLRFGSTVVFAPDGRLLAIGQAGDRSKAEQPGKVLLWNPSSGEVFELLTQGGGVLAAQFYPDGRTLAVLTNQVALWDVEKRAQIRRVPLPERGRQPTALDVSCKANLMAVAAHERTPFEQYRLVVDKGGGAVEVYSTKTGETIAAFRTYQGDTPIWPAFSPDGSILAVVMANREVTFWKLASP